MSHPISIDYYSDLLCIWAWVAQPHLEHLESKYGNRIQLNHHYIDLFGNTSHRMAEQWLERGGYDGFAKHVQHVAFSHDMPIHSQLWQQVKPTTSANAHMVIKVIESLHGKAQAAEIAACFRHAFFQQAKDISSLNELMSIVDDKNLDATSVSNAIKDGKAIARLMTDYQQAKSLGLQGSPTFILDGGRQMLYGNITIETLCANIDVHLSNC
ncbi:DsbA family protein [Thalassotalea sp. G2M2-11]|uniref:DsbA family oxidoreductase n=1 Tax=Thalassotalea sp. G2M2-11 TaxID=2787627 RepID=UPI0019D118F9|nr:DsbA family protein [Thalassotalea sp. G2M2-11]